jgi:KDO2-lipid IV(A) lauroyltransferase
MAVPLVLGTGVDYGIFMQLALRRHQGDVKLAYRSVGRALLLCGGTAIAGFGSLALSSNAGMASLGVVCAVGIGFNMLISIYLLPSWWKLLRESGIAGKNAPAGPSSLYRADLWRTGRRLVRILPRSVCLGIGWAAANIYWVFARHRRAVVVANLLPALVGDVRTAKRVARRLFQEMGIKVCDLLRYESGTPIGDLLGESSGFEHIEAARQRKQGTLLITPHLGNWEFGAAWLARSNVDLHVITLAEPGTDFTQVRQAARARWNISTSVIANDMFGFIEIIRKLEAGATVALLLDRPPAGTGVVVELFGRPFLASMAPAELARATGCLLLPVYVPRTLRGYCAHVLTPVEYQRATLRDPIARRELIQKLMFAFEPLIREHIDQWFHFVPIWPDVGPAKKE